MQDAISVATIKVYGLVQGVFFRQSVKSKAEKLNLNGYVRNEPDGTVIIVTEGLRTNIEKFIEWCEHGTGLAKVDRIKVEWSKGDTRQFDDFSVRYEPR